MGLNAIDEAFRAKLTAILPAKAVRDPGPQYLEEPRGQWRGQAGLVVTPENVEQVAQVIRLAGEARIPVIPYGGGTGLVGGQTAPGGPAPVILSLERMRAVRAVYPQENVMIVEAGLILSEAHDVAAAAGRLFPLSIGSKGSARIGGVLSTNAGGVNMLRYGNARDLCLGLEAVLPDGQIWHGLNRLRKDNTGYDLRNLLIGAEGTLGVITAATLRLVPRPEREATALLVVESPEAALHLLEMARAHMAEGLSAFELIHGQGLSFLAEAQPDLRQPFDSPPEWSVLIDVGVTRGLDPVEILEELFTEALEAGLVHDGLIAQSEAQREDFWQLREQIPEANRHVGAVSSHDISLPLGRIAEFIARAPDVIAGFGHFRINCFGHLGDGNLHYNIFPAAGAGRMDDSELRNLLKRAVHDLVHEMDGSISAEHGIGRLKVADLERYGDPAKLGAMRAIKTALDPLGIMNPGAVLRG